MTGEAKQPPATCPRCGDRWVWADEDVNHYFCNSRFGPDGTWHHSYCCDINIGCKLLPPNAATLPIAERQRLVVEYAKRLGFEGAEELYWDADGQALESLFDMGGEDGVVPRRLAVNLSADMFAAVAHDEDGNEKARATFADEKEAWEWFAAQTANAPKGGAA